MKKLALMTVLISLVFVDRLTAHPRSPQEDGLVTPEVVPTRSLQVLSGVAARPEVPEKITTEDNAVVLPTHVQLQQVAQATTTPFLYLPVNVDWWNAMSAMMDHQCPLGGIDGELWAYPDYATAYNPLYGYKVCADNSTPTNFGASYCTDPEVLPGYEFRTADGCWAWYDGHEGYDWGVSLGTKIYASAAGTVVCAGRAGYGNECPDYSRCYGYIVVIQHANGYRTLYAHLKADSKNPDNLPNWPSVSEYDAIALSGNTTGTGCSSTGAHLHFSVLHNGKYVDPFGWNEWGWGGKADPLDSCEHGESGPNLWVDRIPHRPGQSPVAHSSVPTNLHYVGGAIVQPVPTPEPPPGPDDITPPWATGFSASVSGSTAQITTSGVQDNSGGSDVREVRFSAKFNNQWVGIGNDTTYPYALNWDMCGNDVPDGDVELGMEIWDNAGNFWIWSQHYPNPHITKSYNCEISGQPWDVRAWQNRYLAGYANWEGTFTWDDDYPYIWLHWDDDVPFDGWPADDFSFEFKRNVYFPGGDYHFDGDHDDGIKLYIDGQLAKDTWWDGHNTTGTTEHLSGGYHEVKVEYYEKIENAHLEVWWYGPGYPRPDRDPPSVEWMAPVGNDGSYQAGDQTVRLEVSANDDVAVLRVEFYWYDTANERWVEIGNAYGSPWQRYLDCSTLNLGWNQVTALAVDTAGRYSGQEDIWVHYSPTPSAPSNLRVTDVSQSSITIGWSDNATNETGFQVYKWGYDGSEWLFLREATVSANATSYTDTRLDCGTAHFYTVSAYNANGESNFTDWIEGQTDPCSADVGPVVWGEVWIDDNREGNSYGDGDSNPDCAELIELYTSLCNVGQLVAQEVTATISTQSPYVSWTYNTASSFGDIEPQGNCTLNHDDYDFYISSSAPNGHTIDFSLAITDIAGHRWSDTYSLPPVACDDPIDSYEPDGMMSQAEVIYGNVPQTHNLIPVGDSDWVKFTLGRLSGVTISTQGVYGDTRIWLYDFEGTQLAYNDDRTTEYGFTTFAGISRTCEAGALPEGTYYVQVDAYADSHEVPTYDLLLTTESCLDPYSVYLPLLLSD